MKVEQIYQFVNNAFTETTGQSDLLQEDLSNIVDVGKALDANATVGSNAYDNFVRSLVDHIGKVIFVDRPYSGSVPSVLMDGWEFGSVLEKIQAEIPVATENESWELQDGRSYDPNVFTKPSASAKFFDGLTTFEVPLSLTERQVKSAFSNAQQMNSFISMLHGTVDKAMTVRTDDLIMRTINNAIAETLGDAGIGTGGTATPTPRAINLLAEYNLVAQGDPATKDKALNNPSFVRWAGYAIQLTLDRLRRMSVMFNIEGKQRFTPTDKQHLVTLSNFDRASMVFMESDTYHNNLVKLPSSETVPFWQGTGTDYAFNKVSKINIKTPSGKTVEQDGILGVVFDRDALGVANFNKRVTTNWNPKAEFWNYWHKQDARYFNDFQEQCVVFYIA